jgi:uncharacterized membrane protein YkoI
MTGMKMIGAALAAFMLAGGPARADEGPAEARKLREAGQILPLEAIAERAHAARAGQILETELERSGDRYVYEIEVLDDAGTVWELQLDAKSGEVVEMKQDD